MSIFNQMSRGGYDSQKMEANTLVSNPRTFKQTIEDQINFHKSKIAELEAVRNSMIPEIEKFIEAMQKMG